MLGGDTPSAVISDVSARIGGVKYGRDDHMSSTTELDSHANWPVFGQDSTTVARSGLFATVRGFSDALPEMSKIEIVDKAIAYDCPYFLKTFLLVIRNALDIPTMKHNLIPPYILREAGLFVNEHPKRQAGMAATIDHHCIYDADSSLRIHLGLMGTFSYFPSRALTQFEMENREQFPVVYFTPDSDEWVPTREEWAAEEANMMDHEGNIVIPDLRPKEPLFPIAEIEALYVNPPLWADFDAAVDRQCDHCDWPDIPFTEDHEILFSEDGLQAQVSQVSGVYDPSVFASTVNDVCAKSKAGMALGATNVSSNNDCDLFTSSGDDGMLTQVESVVAAAMAALESVRAGHPEGVSA